MSEKHEKALSEMAQSLYAMRRNGNGYESHRVLNLLSDYAKLMVPDILKLFDDLWKAQNEVKKSYGDFDYALQKFKAEGEDGEHRRCLVIDDHPTTAPHTSFILIHEVEPSELPTFRIENLHVRVLHKKGEPKYRDAEPLSWYKQNAFAPDYGAHRDGGYILTAKIFGRKWRIESIYPDGFQLLTGLILPDFEIVRSIQKSNNKTPN